MGRQSSAKVVLGIDPHKRVNAVCVMDRRGRVLAEEVFPNTSEGFGALRGFALGWSQRTWAVEGARGVGRHLAQRLTAAREVVLDVTTRRAALVRVHGGGNGRKNDSLDAKAVALAALHGSGLEQVRPDDQTTTLRLLSQRRRELTRWRVQTLNRLHRDLLDVLPGGAPRYLTVAKTKALLAGMRPRDELGRLRRQLMADKLADLVRIDAQLLEVHRQIRTAVKVSKTQLTGVYGVGAINAALILGEVRDVARFASRHHFASYNGSAPIDRSSGGGEKQYCVNTEGNRRLNNVLHIAAISQLRQAGSPGRAYYLRKRAEGKTTKEALRCLKRRISDVIYQALLDDAAQARKRGPGGHLGATTDSSAADPIPTASSSDKPQPGPRPNPSPSRPRRQPLRRYSTPATSRPSATPSGRP